MTRRTKFGIFGAIALVVVVGLFMMSRSRRANAATEVRMDTVATRDLVAAVTASGRIEAKSSVDISADITGRIIQIAVKEGDWVTKGQFLVQIDPSEYQAAVSRAEGLVASSQASVVQARANRDQAKRAADRATELAKAGPNLISPEMVEQAVTAHEVAEANLRASEATMDQARAGLRQAQEQLAKTRLTAPMAGRVVRVAKEVGEVAVQGTFSSEQALLVTIADLSVIQANVKVDETDVVRLSEGDSVEVTIDAFPDSSFAGRVTKVSNSALLSATATASGSTDQAVDFEVEITLDNPPADIRPDLSCTARIITDVREDVLSVPIIALTVRDNTPLPSERGAGSTQLTDADTTRPAGSPGDSGAKRSEIEGVFVVENGMATFRPVKVGIAGDEHFEILSGLQVGDSIVSGTYQTIRDLRDSTKVRALPASMPGGPGARS
jgi:HlyD family secretion protein